MEEERAASCWVGESVGLRQDFLQRKEVSPCLFELAAGVQTKSQGELSGDGG